MNRHFLNRLFWGLTLIAVGVLFLLNQMNLIAFDLGTLFAVYWPVLLIFFGLKGMLFHPGRDGGRGGAYIWNGLIILIGAFFLLRNLDVELFERVDLWELIVPVVLILIGFHMLANGSKDRRDVEGPEGSKGFAEPKANIPEPTHGWNNGQGGIRSHSAVNRSNFIGDIWLGQDEWQLEPTNVSHFIGDTVIDLTKASIPYGETKVTVSTFIGDLKVYVPNDSQLEVSVIASAFIGDMAVLDRRESGLFKHIKLDTPFYQQAEKKIHLIVSTFIGDIEVKRVG